MRKFFSCGLLAFDGALCAGGFLASSLIFMKLKTVPKDQQRLEHLDPRCSISMCQSVTISPAERQKTIPQSRGGR